MLGFSWSDPTFESDLVARIWIVPIHSEGALTLNKRLPPKPRLSSLRSPGSYHSTETALLKVLNDLLLVADRGEAALLALLDQSAAFDTIDHGILLERIQSRFGMDGTALAWLRSYLSNRIQAVSVAGVTSSPQRLHWGVPQGSVLGPILFILYSSPMHDIPPRFSVCDHYYADDTQFYTSFNLSAEGQCEAYRSMAGCIAEARLWMTANKLKLNEAKTEALLVYGLSSKRKPASPLMVGGEQTCGQLLRN